MAIGQPRFNPQKLYSSLYGTMFALCYTAILDKESSSKELHGKQQLAGLCTPFLERHNDVGIHDYGR